MAETLVGAGYDVTVVCKLADDLPRDETVNGVRYIRVPMRARFLRPRSGLLKFRAFASFVGKTVMALKPTIIHANDLISLPAATRLAEALRAKVVFDVHDLYLHGPKKRSRLAYWHGERVEWDHIRLADAVMTVSDGMADHLRDAYRIRRPAVVMNAPDGIGHADPSPRRLRDEIGLSDDQPLGVYTGARSRSRGLERLVHALSAAPGVHMAMVGHSQSVSDSSLMSIAREGGSADRLHLLPPVPHTEVPSFIASADFGVLPYHVNCANHEYSMPHKLFESVFAGLPVAVPSLHEVRKFVESTGTGLVMNALDVDDIGKTLRLMASRRSELRIDPDKVKSLVGRFGWPVQAKVIVDLYAGLSTDRPGH